MILLLIIAAVILGGFFLKNHYEYWKKRAVPGPEPKYLFGNLKESFLMKKSLSDVYTEIYRQFPNSPLVGIFRGTSPTILVKDPQLIRDITVKEFASFHDNDLFIDKNADPLFGRNAFVLRGEEWKTTRGFLTPNFTSGKLKSVYPLLEGVSEKFVSFISDEIAKGQPLEGKDFCTKLTMNNVMTCAFGLEGKCFEETNPDFQILAQGFLTPEGFNMIKLFLIQIIPQLQNIMSIRFTPVDVEKKVIEIITSTVKYRRDNQVIRSDFLNMLMGLKEKVAGFTDLDVTAQSAGFFVDGVETSAFVMNHVLFELANSPKSQENLRTEITKNFEENDGKIPCEVLQDLPYLDAVINETLRLHPAFVTSRKCTKDYKYEMSNGKSLIIEKGMSIIFPSYAIQRDEKYFEDPDTYNPERFLKENKDKLEKFAFLPFGEGPRICLGKRFGLLQIKAGVAYFIKNFKVKVNGKTQLPFKIDPVAFLLSPVGGIWLDIEKI